MKKERWVLGFGGLGLLAAAFGAIRLQLPSRANVDLGNILVHNVGFPESGVRQSSDGKYVTIQIQDGVYVRGIVVRIDGGKYTIEANDLKDRGW